MQPCARLYPISAGVLSETPASTRTLAAVSVKHHITGTQA
jgi:hypothetical protein